MWGIDFCRSREDQEGNEGSNHRNLNNQDDFIDIQCIGRTLHLKINMPCRLGTEDRERNLLLPVHSEVQKLWNSYFNWISYFTFACIYLNTLFQRLCTVQLKPQALFDNRKLQHTRNLHYPSQKLAVRLKSVFRPTLLVIPTAKIGFQNTCVTAPMCSAATANRCTTSSWHSCLALASPCTFQCAAQNFWSEAWSAPLSTTLPC